MKRVALAGLAALVFWLPRLHAAMEMELQGDTLFLRGAPITGDDWGKYVDLTSGKSFSKVVLVNQGGGQVRTALWIARDLIRRGVTTVALGHCYSACTLIFLAGDRRQFGGAWPISRSRLGFHGVYSKETGNLSLGNSMMEVGVYYRSRLGEEAQALIEKALLQFPNRRGFLYLYHPLHRGWAAACPGTLEEKCVRTADVDPVRLGLLTTSELAEVSLPERFVVREQLFGVELGTFQRFAGAEELAQHCPAQAAANCARATQVFVSGATDRAAAMSARGAMGVSLRSNDPRRAAWSALYQCVRLRGEPCRVLAVNDVVTLDLYGIWLGQSEEALLKIRAGEGDAAADERHEKKETRMSSLRTDDFSGPTPEDIPGVREVGTRTLLDLMRGAEGVALIDVGCVNTTVPGAKCILGAGFAFKDPGRDEAHEKLLLGLLDALVPDRRAPIVFFSVSSNSWLAANAAFRAAKADRNVIWYRGGLNAWKAAGLPMVNTAPVGAMTE